MIAKIFPLTPWFIIEMPEKLKITNWIHNFWIAVEAILNNRFRALLTSLGLIFGVASVISMLSIGKGAEQEILEQLKILGTNNIIIKPIVEQEEGKVEEESSSSQEQKKFSPGLTLADVKTIEKVIPNLEYVSPEVTFETLVIRSGLKRSVKLVGVLDKYFESVNLELAQGKSFSDNQITNSIPVCVIGSSIKAKFFPKEEPIGKTIKCGNIWFRVIGILKEKNLTTENISKLGIRDYNMDIYAPITSVLLRIKNRAIVTKDDILRNSRKWGDKKEPEKNYHQLDRIVVRVKDTKDMNATANILNRMLKRLHNDLVDFEIILPQTLLEQEQKTKQIFNVVLGAIASISLLVGGIGIMNIMLASVLERIKEIGIRLAVGAKKKDIIMQFLFESITIGIAGGVLGIILGYVLSSLIEKFSGIVTIITPISIILSLFIAVTIGLVFGILPAKRAAEQDPITSLRYE